MNDGLFASNIKIQNKIFVNFCVSGKNKIQNICSEKFSEMTKKQKIFCKKTPPQGTKSGKSKHKNIEAVNSRIDGLFFVFIFVFSPPQGPKLNIHDHAHHESRIAK